MSPEQTIPVKKRLANRIVLAAAVLLATFLVGFLPVYMKAQRLEKELQEARQENSQAHLRDLAGLAYLQASQRDYGLATATSSRLFERMREVASQTQNSEAKKSMEALLTLRDPINAKLATSNPEVVHELRELLVKTREVTAASTEVAHP